MTLTHDDLKVLYKLLYQQQEDLSVLAARLASCERALQDVADVQRQETGVVRGALNGAGDARLDS